MRERRRYAVELATWAYENNHRRLYRALHYYWRFRNRVWWPVSDWFGKQWWRVKVIFMPKCKSCGYVIMYGLCFMCRMRQTIKVRSLRP